MQSVSESPAVKVSSDKCRRVNFEEALRRTGFGKFNYLLVILSGAVLSTVLLETLGISFILPVAECDLNLSTKDKGLLSAIAFAGIIASSHLWGFLADTKGRRKVIMPTLFISFAITIVSSFVKSFWLFTLLRFFSGLFISGGSATIYAYLGEFHNLKTRSRVLMGAAFVFGIFCLCLPLLAFIVLNQEWQIYIAMIDVHYKPWRFFIAVCGSLSAICGICFFFLPESPKFIFATGDEEKTLKILEKIYRINNCSVEKFDVDEILKDSDYMEAVSELTARQECCFFDTFKLMWNQTVPLFNKEHLKNTFVACLVQFLIFLTSNGLYMFFPEILNRMADYTKINPDPSITVCEILDATRTSYSKQLHNETELNHLCITKLELSTYEHTFVLEALYAFGFAIIGMIINYTGKLPIILFVLFGCGSCAISLIFVNVPYVSTYLYVILLACGLAINVVNASTIELYPTSLRAMAVCISLMFGRLGSVFGSNLVGLLLDTHCQVTFAFSGVTLFFSGILVFFIPNISDRR